MDQNYKFTIIVGIQLDQKISKDIKDLNYTINHLLHIYRITKFSISITQSVKKCSSFNKF